MVSAELMVAYIVFTIVLIIVVYLWGSVVFDILAAEDLSDIEGAAVDVSENLVRTAGIPENWSRADVKTIGLCNSSRNINEDKLSDFIYMMNTSLYNNSCGGGISNYECNKHLTGIGNYDFYFAMEYINDSTLSLRGIPCTTGMRPSQDTKKVTMVRTSQLNMTIVRIRLTVWK